jgi:hypothetical protein
MGQDGLLQVYLFLFFSNMQKDKREVKSLNIFILGLKDEESIENFLKELISKKSEPWRAMKMVMLGHGRIGKTTLLHAMKSILQPNNPEKVNI